jgi:excisionase family DNA binding protein
MDLRPDSYTVREATSKLGISEDAVRKRIKRGSIESYKSSGRVYVIIHTDIKVVTRQTMSESQQSLETEGILSNSEAINTFKLFKETTTITIEMLREQNEMYIKKNEIYINDIEKLQEENKILTEKNKRLIQKNKDLFQEVVNFKEDNSKKKKHKNKK